MPLIKRVILAPDACFAQWVEEPAITLEEMRIHRKLMNMWDTSKHPIYHQIPKRSILTSQTVVGVQEIMAVI